MKQIGSSLFLLMLLCGHLAAQQTTQQNTQVSKLGSPWMTQMSSGVSALSEDRFDDAEKDFKSAIEVVKENRNDPRLAAAINNLGVLYQRQARYDEAGPLHQRALELRVKTLGKEHPDVAQSLNNLATVHLAQKRYPQVIPLYERAIAIWKKTRGEDYYKIAAALNNLATLYDAQDQYDEANRLYEESLAVWNKSGVNDLHHAQTLENYAGLLHRMNAQTKAAQTLSEAKTIRIQAASAAPAN